MLLNREALLVLETADTSLTSLSDDLADRLSDPRRSLPERCKDNKTHTRSYVSTEKGFVFFLEETRFNQTLHDGRALFKEQQSRMS